VTVLRLTATVLPAVGVSLTAATFYSRNYWKLPRCATVPAPTGLHNVMQKSHKSYETTVSRPASTYLY